MRFSEPSPVLDKNRAPMGPEMLSSTGAGVYRKAPEAFPDSSSVLDESQSAINLKWNSSIEQMQGSSHQGPLSIRFPAMPVHLHRGSKNH